MTQPPTCPTCHAPLPGGTGPAGGLCPACLLRRGLEAQTAGFTEPGPTAAPRWEPPGVAELGVQFPELEILELVGRGGMGAVYRVRQRGLDRVAALKVLPPHLGSDPAFAERFAREAKALAKLNHPNVVTLYEFGRTDVGGLYFFLMEYVDGASLRRLMDAGRVAPREALAIVPQVCDALQYAHDHGVVHRDIKPENILLDRRGRVKVADFGLAKITGQDDPAAAGGGATATATLAVTEAGQVFGTPQYMAPEQVDRPGSVDHRADIYALGVVFYQMLTGELPAGRIEPPSRKVVVDVRLDEVVLRALEREPARRYGQASELKTDVETVAGVAHAVPLDYRRPAEIPTGALVPPGARLSWPAVAGVFCCVAGVIAAVVLVVAYREMRNPGATLTTLGRVLLFVSVPVALAAPFATTILGWTAVSQIRRSAGRQYGLGLALFDGLLFPLLLLDAVVVFLAGGARLGVAEGLILALPLDAWLTRKAWRAGQRPVPPAPGEAAAAVAAGAGVLNYARQSRGRRMLQAVRRTAPIWGGATVVLAVIIVGLLAWVQQPRAVGADVSADSPDGRYSASATTMRAVRVFGPDHVYYRIAVRGPGGKPTATWEVPFPQSGLLARQNQAMLLSQLTFSGNGAIRWSDDGGRVDFELTAPDGTIVNLIGYDVRAGSPTAGRGFGPERRLTLAGSRELKGCFADLDTGEVLSAPTTWVQALRSRGHLYEGATPPGILAEWMEPAGADLFRSATLDGGAVPWPVVQVGGAVVYLAESSFSFETISAEQVVEWIRAARPAATTNPTGGPDFFPLPPDTLHVFRTREGSLGVLQYQDDGPGRIEVRYKLVAGVPTTRPSGPPSRGPAGPQRGG